MGAFFCKSSICIQLIEKGADNPVADNLSRMENIPHDPTHVNDSFPDEQLAVVKVISHDSPWYADYANLLSPNFCLQVLLINKGRNSFMI